MYLPTLFLFFSSFLLVEFDCFWLYFVLRLFVHCLFFILVFLTSLVRSWSLSLVYCVIAGGVSNGGLHKRTSIPDISQLQQEYCIVVFVTLYVHVDPHHVYTSIIDSTLVILTGVSDIQSLKRKMLLLQLRLIGVLFAFVVLCLVPLVLYQLFNIINNLFLLIIVITSRKQLNSTKLNLPLILQLKQY